MTLLFIHGSGFTGEAFAAQMPAFPGAHAPNLPGHDSPGSPATVAEFAEFIEKYVGERGLSNPVLAGNSLGGAIALECAMRGNIPIAGIALIGSGARLRVAPAILDGLERDFESTIAQLATLFFAEPTPGRVRGATERLRRTGQPQVARDFAACNAFDVLDRLGELSVPLLALTGEADVLTPPKFARALVDRVAGGQSRIVPAAGHLLMIERPVETNAAIRAFVDEIR